MFVEKHKQFAFDVCIMGWDEGHSTHATRREAVYQQCNQPGRQAMSRPAENKEIVTQCTADVTALHFQGKTVCI